jgi:hypothetical protein
MSLVLPILAVLHAASPAAGPELEVSPLLLQEVALFLSDEVTAGGVGGAVGVQLEYRDVYLAQVDVGLMWTLGNAVATRAAVGVQRPGTWKPAILATFAMLWGDRIEFLTGDGSRPSIPSWSLGVRGAPLRFGTTLGTISALEPGIGSDFAGALWLELTWLQASARF